VCDHTIQTHTRLSSTKLLSGRQSILMSTSSRSKASVCVSVLHGHTLRMRTVHVLMYSYRLHMKSDGSHPSSECSLFSVSRRPLRLCHMAPAGHLARSQLPPRHHWLPRPGLLPMTFPMDVICTTLCLYTVCIRRCV